MIVILRTLRVQKTITTELQQKCPELVAKHQHTDRISFHVSFHRFALLHERYSHTHTHTNGPKDLKELEYVVIQTGGRNGY